MPEVSSIQLAIVKHPDHPSVNSATSAVAEAEVALQAEVVEAPVLDAAATVRAEAEAPSTQTGIGVARRAQCLLAIITTTSPEVALDPRVLI